MNTFTCAARMDALRNGKIQIETLDTSSSSSAGSSFMIRYTSNKKKYEDYVERTVGTELIENVMHEVLARTSTSRRRNTEGLKKIFSLPELAARAPWMLWSLVRYSLVLNP